MPQIIPAIVTAVKWVWAAKSVMAAVIKFTVTIAASYAIGRALSPKLRTGLTTGSPLDLTRDPLTPRRVAYGETRLGGSIRFYWTTGGNNNLHHYLIIVWTGHPSKAIDELYFNDELVPLDGSGNATGTYAGLVRCTHHLGAWDQAADANFVAELGGSIWTSNDRLRGCTYSAIRIKYDAAKFPGGMPAITAKGRWRIPYDPRDAGQDADDPSTWLYTNNADVCFHDYLRGVPIKIGDGSIARLMGVNAADEEIDEAAAIAAMNVCDETVARNTGFTRACDVASGNRHIGTASLTGIVPGMAVSGTGLPAGSLVVATDDSGPFFTIDQDPTATNSGVTLTFGDSEKRYTVNGAFDLDAAPSTVVDHFLSATAGKLHDVGGDLVIRAGAWVEPDTVLDVTALRSGGVTVTAPLSWREKVNYVRGTFSEPAQNYARTDFPSVISDALITADGAELPVDLDLTGFVTSPAQAQRLAKIKLLRTRQGIVATKACNLRGAVALTGENYRYTDDDLGWEEKAFELLEFTLSLERDKNGRSGFVTDLTGQETDESIYDWATDEEKANDPAPNTTLPDPRNVAAPTGVTLTSAGQGFVQPDGSITPRLKVSWTAPVDQAVLSAGRNRVQYKKSSDSDWSEAENVKGDQVFLFILDVLIGVAYDVRVQAENNLGVPSAWATPAAGAHTVVGDTTAPNAATSLSVTAYAGYNEIKWTGSSSADISEYKIYRHTSDDSAAATEIGEIDGTKFRDPTATAGVAYWYYVAAVDGSENVGTRTLAGTVTTAAVPATDVAPTNPTAATKTGEGTYDAGDGTVFAKLLFTVPGLPANARWQNLLHRKNGEAQWMIGGQYDNAAQITSVPLDDLSPGVAYEVGTQAFSAYGKASSVVAATSSPFTAPNKTSCNPPTSIVYIAGNAAGFGREQRYYDPGSGNVRLFMARANWTKPADNDVDHYDYVLAAAGSSALALNTSWTSAPTTTPIAEVVLGETTPAAVALYVRTVNTSGVKSAWLEGAAISSPTNYWGYTAGSSSAKDIGTSAGNVCAGDDARLSDTRQCNNTFNNAGTSRTNLGLGTAATKDTTAMGNLTVGDLTSDEADGWTPLQNAGGHQISFKWDSGLKVRIDATELDVTTT